ncbi:MAG: M48 family metalloprotease [Deltaproteobacteria bacterium]|nr:MAG: M48 family metalloprotease [Deltaproteobacteria bacterium]
MKVNRFCSLGILLVIIFLTSGCFGSGSHNPFQDLFRLSLEEEKKLSQMILEEIRKQKQLVRDPYIQQYVEDVGQRIVAQIGPQPFHYNFYVLNDPNINAFAIPAGHIFIYSGLFNMLDNESELAGVLCHEIAHSVARHIAQQIEKASKLTLPTLAAIMAGAMLGGGGEATEAVIAGSLAGETSLMLKFSREDEEEADRLGFSYITQAGYDSCGIVRFLFKLAKEYGIMSGRLASYQSTHPEIIHRITYLETMISPSRQCWGRREESGTFRRIKARSIIETRGTQSAIKYFNQQLRDDPQDLESLYGLALSYQKARNMDEAIDILEKVIAQNPEDAEVRRDLGIVYFDAREFEKAAVYLEEATAAMPEDVVCLYYLGRAYEEKGELDKSLEAYKQVIVLEPRYFFVYRNLGLIYDRKGLYAQSHDNLGIYFELQGERDKALFHFKKAQELYEKYSKEAERIEKKIKELSREGIVDHHR